jgi:hypothetical protein
MTWYRPTFEGRRWLLEASGTQRACGFFTTRVVQGSDEKDAISKALLAIRSELCEIACVGEDSELRLDRYEAHLTTAVSDWLLRSTI